MSNVEPLSRPKFVLWNFENALLAADELWKQYAEDGVLPANASPEALWQFATSSNNDELGLELFIWMAIYCHPNCDIRTRRYLREKPNGMTWAAWREYLEQTRGGAR